MNVIQTLFERYLPKCYLNVIQQLLEHILSVIQTQFKYDSKENRIILDSNVIQTGFKS